MVSSGRTRVAWGLGLAGLVASGIQNVILCHKAEKQKERENGISEAEQRFQHPKSKAPFI